jgi:opacity protein-like surface antigen
MNNAIRKLFEFALAGVSAMKKLSFFTGCLLCVAVSVQAQAAFKPFRVDMGAGCAVVGSGNGVLVYLEPRYAVMPQLSVGLKMELDFMVRDFKTIEAGGKIYSNVKAQMFSSYILTADYHLTRSRFRPFIGAGIGADLISAVKFELSSSPPAPDVASKTNFGTMLRAGFDVCHLRLTLACNFAGKDGLEKNADFYSASLGIYFGGGKK